MFRQPSEHGALGVKQLRTELLAFAESVFRQELVAALQNQREQLIEDIEDVLADRLMSHTNTYTSLGTKSTLGTLSASAPGRKSDPRGSRSASIKFVRTNVEDSDDMQTSLQSSESKRSAGASSGVRNAGKISESGTGTATIQTVKTLDRGRLSSSDDSENDDEYHPWAFRHMRSAAVAEHSRGFVHSPKEVWALFKEKKQRLGRRWGVSSRNKHQKSHGERLKQAFSANEFEATPTTSTADVRGLSGVAVVPHAVEEPVEAGEKHEGSASIPAKVTPFTEASSTPARLPPTKSVSVCEASSASTRVVPVTGFSLRSALKSRGSAESSLKHTVTVNGSEMVAAEQAQDATRDSQPAATSDSQPAASRPSDAPERHSMNLEDLRLRRHSEVTYGKLDTYQRGIRSKKPTGLCLDVEETVGARDLSPSRNLGITNSDFVFQLVSEFTHREVLEAIVYSSGFEYIFVALIIANAIAIGLQTDYMARHVLDEVPKQFYCVEVAFCLIFTVEVSLRVAVNWNRYFYGPGNFLNIFDCILVLVEMLELLLSLLTSEAFADLPKPNFYALRMLRIVRIVRIARTIRVLRMVGEIRSLIWSVGASLKPLIGAILIIVLAIYVVSVYFTELALAKRSENRRNSIHDDLGEHYGSLGQCMFSLYHSISGGIDWSELSRNLNSNGLHFAGSVLLPLFIAFNLLALMNVITGVFVESAFQKAKLDKEQYTVSYVRNIFSSIDTSNHGAISYRQFKSQLATRDMQELFRSIDLDVSEAKGVFHLLDLNGSGFIDADEFLSGCLRLRGQAKALDLLLVMKEMKRMFSVCTEQFHDIQVSLRAFKGFISSNPDSDVTYEVVEESVGDGPTAGEELVQVQSFVAGEVFTS